MTKVMTERREKFFSHEEKNQSFFSDAFLGQNWSNAYKPKHYIKVWKVKVVVIQLCPILWGPMGCSPPGSSVHGILQARILQWVATPFSRGSF